MNDAVSASEKSMSIDPRFEAAVHRPAGLGEHGQHAAVVAERLGREAFDPVRAGDRREVFEQQRGDALAVMAVVDHERHLGVVAVVPAFVARPGDELAVLLDHERRPIDEVDVREALQLGVVSSGFGEKKRR